MDILVGADPELFVWDKQEKKFVSGHGMVEGTKKEPYPVEGGAVQVDGMALEFNIDPARNADEFVERIVSVKQQLQDMIGDRYELKAVPVAEFGKKYIQEQPEEARILGCDPDYSAYTQDVNENPNADMPFRTASGHIHIGWCEDIDETHPDHFTACVMLARHMDLFIGLQSYAWSDVDVEMKRRELYGKAGCFRPKSYGMEYRTPSNAWLKDEKIIRHVYNQTIACFDNLVRWPETHEPELYAGIVKRLNNPKSYNYSVIEYGEIVNETLDNSIYYKAA